MPIKQVWNKQIAKQFNNMTFDEQAKLYREFKSQFDRLSKYNLSTANQYFKEYLEETIIIACNGDVVAQDFLTYIYKKGRTGLFEANLLQRYCGRVIESFAAFEKQRKRLATKIQLSAVPIARPMPIHACPKPKARILPGSPISSQALISDAWALIAVTHGPIFLPPKK